MNEPIPRPARNPLGLLGLGALALLAALAAAPEADAGAVLDNGLVQLGVDDHGQLNIPGPPSWGGVPVVGLRYVPTNAESTSPGCLCEGWGVSYDNTVSGWANNAGGGTGGCMSGATFTSTPPLSATSTVDVCDLRVTHDFHPAAATTNLFEVTVTIENIGTVTHGDIIYRRAMDWDVEPTPFSEYSTIDFAGGTPPTELLQSSNNGFASTDPLTPMGGTPGPFTDLGPTDHGAAFDFSFGSLLPGMSLTFNIYYGAAADEPAADSARIAAGLQVWSYGQPSTPGGASAGTPNTFIFGFGALTPTRCDAIAKTGRAYIAHVHNWDVGNTGYVGPADTWVVDSGDMYTYAPMTLDATTASHTGPLMSGKVLFARTTAQPCESTARTAVAHLVSGPMSPVPFEIKVGEVVSSSDCRGHSGSTTLAYLMVNNVVLIDTTNQPPPNTKIYLGPITVTLNEHEYSPGVLHVTAVRIEWPGVVDARVLSARSDIHGCGGGYDPPCGYAVGVDGKLQPVLERCCEDRPTGIDLGGDHIPAVVTDVEAPCDPCPGLDVLRCICAVKVPTTVTTVPTVCCEGFPPRTGVGLPDVSVLAPAAPVPCMPCRLPGPATVASSTTTEFSLDCPCPTWLGVDVDPAVPWAAGQASLTCGPCSIDAQELADGSVPTHRTTGTAYCDPCPLLPPDVVAITGCRPCAAWVGHDAAPVPVRADAALQCGPCDATATERVGMGVDRGVETLRCDPCLPGLAMPARVPCEPCIVVAGHDADAAAPQAFGFVDASCWPCEAGAREVVDGSVPMQYGDGYVRCDPCPVVDLVLHGTVPCEPCVVKYQHEESVSPTAVADVAFRCGPCFVQGGLLLDGLTLTDYVYGGAGCDGCLVSGMALVPDVCVTCDVFVDHSGIDPTANPPNLGTINVTSACNPCIGSPCLTPPCPPVDPSNPCGLLPLPPPSTLPVVGPPLAPLDPVVAKISAMLLELLDML